MKTAQYIGDQETLDGGKFKLFNLLRDLEQNGIIKHCTHSTVSEMTLRKFNIQIPENLVKGQEL
jgi:hypothetical protein